MSDRDITKIVTIEPGKRGGKPCIRCMRITVYDVLKYLASGMTYQEILDDFPYPTQQDILACLSFAANIALNQAIPPLQKSVESSTPNQAITHPRSPFSPYKLNYNHQGIGSDTYHDSQPSR